MSREKVKELLKKRSTKIGSIVLAAAIVFSGSMWAWKDSKSTVPELVTYVDMPGDIVIEEDETPLAAPTVKTTTKTKKKTKKIKLKKASKKTYTQKGKTKTKTRTSTENTATATVTTKVVTETSVVYKFKKKSKVKTQITTTKTTTTVTTTPKTTTTTTTTQSSKATTTNTRAVAAANTAMTAAAAAPSVDSRVQGAFDKMGFSIKTASGVNYDGLFDARSRTITLNAAKDTSETVYHELGHFLAFIAGNYDKGGEFGAIFAAEKANYTEYNKAYVCSNAAEYFAESFKNYTLNPAALQASRPQTYAAIEKCLAKVTDTQINLLMSAYSAIWQ